MNSASFVTVSVPQIPEALAVFSLLCPLSCSHWVLSMFKFIDSFLCPFHSDVECFISVIFSLLIFSFGSLKNLLFLCWGCIFTSCVHNCLLNAFSTAAFTPLWSHSNTSLMLVLSTVDCPFSPVQCLPGSCYDKWFFHWKPNILCIRRFWILFKPSALDDFFWRHAGREEGYCLATARLG